MPTPTAPRKLTRGERLLKQLEQHVAAGGEVDDATGRPLRDAISIEIAKGSMARPVDFLKLGR